MFCQQYCIYVVVIRIANYNDNVQKCKSMTNRLPVTLVRPNALTKNHQRLLRRCLVRRRVLFVSLPFQADDFLQVATTSVYAVYNQTFLWKTRDL